MTQTNIFTSRKLEKIATGFISYDNKIKNQYLVDWTSTLFYVSHKKCWLIINRLTKYVIILPNIRKSNLKNIPAIFRETFYEQLIYDRITVNKDLIDKIIGDVKLFKTDNDRSSNGSLNNILLYIDDWKYEFGNYENMPFRELSGRINSLPNKLLDWCLPKEKMNELIKTYAQQRL